MAGGDATQAGILFQNQVAAWAAVHILAGTPILDIGDAVPTSLELETTSPVDDIVIATRNGGRLFLNVKTAVSSSQNLKSELSKVFDQFVRQWLLGVFISAPQAFRPLDVGRDRLVLVLQASRSQEFATSFDQLLRRIRDRSQLAPVDELATNQYQKEVLENCLVLLRHHWKQQCGTDVDNTELVRLLSAVRIVPVGFDGAARTALQLLLSQSIIADSDKANQALDALIQIASEYSVRRSGGDALAIREQLRLRNIALREAPQFQPDIARLEQLTQETLAALSRYGYLKIIEVPGVSRHISIHRTCTNALVDSAKSGSLLVIGEPGSGKSGALQAAARALLDQGHSVVVLAVDQLSANSLEALRTELRLDHRLVDVLANWHPSKTPVLLIDALDANRGGSLGQTINQLLRAVQEKAPHWHIVASIRKFDLRFGTIYCELFAGRPIAQDFADPEFVHITHLNIPQLTNDEIAEVRQQWPHLDNILTIAHEKFIVLLKNPFNLFLLAAILSRPTTTDIGRAKTQLDLLQEYWAYRVNGDTPAEGLKHNCILLRLVDEMISQRRLFAVPELIYEFSSLLSCGVLHQSPSSNNRVSFAHHVLFDFALAKLKLLANGTESLKDTVNGMNDDLLLVTPAVMLALADIWGNDTTRNVFWQVAIELAQDNSAHAFVRSLPARVAAESIATFQDTAPLIAHIDSSNPAIREAGLLLVKHIFGVLYSQVIDGIPKFGDERDPWCAIARAVCEAAMSDVIWPMKAIIPQWTDQPNLTSSQQDDLGVCSRRMLDVELPLESPDPGAISSAITGIVRTFKTDADESEHLLRKLLEPERVTQYGHTELFHFATAFRQIAHYRPQLAADLLIAVFTTPLPSADEATLWGSSRILSLTSNKRQDFEGVRYELNKQIDWFLSNFIDCAISAFQRILNAANEADGLNANELSSTVVGIQNFRMHADYSYLWWTEDSAHHEVRASLLDALVRALIEVAEDDGRSDLHCYLSLLLNGDVWAGTVAAFLKACIQSKRMRAQLGVDFLTSECVLSKKETSFLAGELIKLAHIDLSQNERERIEQAIGKLQDQKVRVRLLGCLDSGLIVDQSTRNLRQDAERNGTIPLNTSMLNIEAGWGRDDHWWLRSEGVDVETPLAKTILYAIDQLDIKNLPNDQNEALDALAKTWPKALELARLLETEEGIHRQLQSQGWDTLAEICDKSAHKCRNSVDLTRFPDILRLIGLSLSPTLDPPPIHDQKSEDDFKKSPCWGRPAPRITAAAALMSFVRANESATTLDSDQILALAKDPAVAVRFAILSRANVVFVAAPELARALARIALDEEQNIGVIKFFLISFDSYIGSDVEWSTTKILELDRRIPKTNEDRIDGIASNISGLVLRLWLTWKIDAAWKRLAEWADESLDNAERIGGLLGDLRKLVNYGDPKKRNADADAIRQKGRELFSRIVENLAAEHEKLCIEAIESRAQQHERLAACTRLLDSAAHTLYFGSGAYELSKLESIHDRVTSEGNRRFLIEYRTALSRLSHVAYPSITHLVLQTIEAFVQDGPEETLELLLEAVVSGGREGGYPFESLGASLVVKLVRRFLADYSALIANTPRYRQGIVDILNLFADAGWPEAKKLVYALPEMLR